MQISGNYTCDLFTSFNCLWIEVQQPTIWKRDEKQHGRNDSWRLSVTGLLERFYEPTKLAGRNSWYSHLPSLFNPSRFCEISLFTIAERIVGESKNKLAAYPGCMQYTINVVSITIWSLGCGGRVDPCSNWLCQISQRPRSWRSVRWYVSRFYRRRYLCGYDGQGVDLQSKLQNVSQAVLGSTSSIVWEGPGMDSVDMENRNSRRVVVPGRLSQRMDPSGPHEFHIS